MPYYIFYTPVHGLWMPWMVQGAVVAGILAGFHVTWRLLAWYKMLPGTPITLGFGIAALVLATGALQAVNLAMGGRFVPPW